MATLFHPTIPDHKVEVPDSQAPAWVEQGWLTDANPTTNPTTDADPYAGE